jgi:hypothetical protein
VPPGWLDDFGTAVSVILLLGLGVVNLRAVLSAEPGTVAPSVFVAALSAGQLVRTLVISMRSIQCNRPPFSTGDRHDLNDATLGVDARPGASPDAETTEPSDPAQAVHETAILIVVPAATVPEPFDTVQFSPTGWVAIVML